MTDAPVCTECGAYVQKSWDWCEVCGFDPNHLKPEHWQPRAEAAQLAPVITAPKASTWARAATFDPDLDTSKPGIPERPPPRSSSARLAIAAVLVVAVLVVGFVAMKFLGTDPSAVAGGRIGDTAGSTVPPWARVESPDRLFSVELPGAPSVAGAQEDGAFVKTMTWSDGVNVYRVSWHEQADPALATVVEQQAALQAYADRLTASGSTATLTQRNGQAVVVFEGHNPSGQPTKGIALLGANQPRLLASGPTALAEADRFFDSYAVRTS